MIAYLKGVIKTIDDKGFDGKDGKRVEYKEVYFQTVDENGFQETGKLTTTKDLSAHINEPITLKIKAREEGKFFKLSIIEVVNE